MATVFVKTLPAKLKRQLGKREQKRVMVPVALTSQLLSELCRVEARRPDRFPETWRASPWQASRRCSRFDGPVSLREMLRPI
jgi:hypothetical protein